MMRFAVDEPVRAYGAPAETLDPRQGVVRRRFLRGAGWLLAGATSVVALLGLSATVARFGFGVEHGPLNIISALDFYLEATLQAWYSSLLLFAAAALLAGIGFLESRRRERAARHWIVLGAIFLLMSIDESVAIHERTSWPIGHFIQPRGIYLYSWVIPAAMFVLVLGVTYLRFLFRLPRRTRNLFIASAAIYLFAVLGMEMIEGAYHWRYTNEDGVYATLVAFEEILEMVGIALFIYALLDYACARYPFVTAALDAAAAGGASAPGPQVRATRAGPPPRDPAAPGARGSADHAVASHR